MDQAGDILLLKRIGYPFPSLATSGGIYPNENGSLSSSLQPHEWSHGVPVCLAGGDLNRVGFMCRAACPPRRIAC